MSDELELDVGDTPTPTPEPPAQPDAIASATDSSSIKNATLSHPFTKEGVTTDIGYTFSLPSYPRDVLTNLLRQAELNPEINLKAETLKDWARVVNESIDKYTPGSLYQSRFRDPNSHFQQGVEKEDGSLASIAAPKFKNATGELSPEVAVLRISKAMGLGDTLTIPLPHSGIVVTIKPPKERDIINFYNTIFREKIYLGRMSAGLTLTNMSVYINSKLFNFILSHVHSINYGDIPVSELGNYILVHDLPILAWGFAATQYPNGFDFERACVSDVKVCSHVAKDVINMLKLLWVDNTMLSASQRTVLTDYRPNQQKVETYRSYISQHVRVKPKDVKLDNGTTIRLKVPTVAEHIADGMGWISRINSDIENLIIEDPEKEQAAKGELLVQYVNASILRQYSHFVEYIELEDGIISSREGITSTLELLSSNDKVRTELVKKVLDYKAETTIALIGIPSYKCPSCGAEQNPDPVNPNLVSVIPIDVMSTFFTLLTLRMSKILERE